MTKKKKMKRMHGLSNVNYRKENKGMIALNMEGLAFAENNCFIRQSWEQELEMKKRQFAAQSGRNFPMLELFINLMICLKSSDVGYSQA